MRRRTLGIGAVVLALFGTGLWAGIGSARLGGASAAIAVKAALAARGEVPRPTGVKAGAGGAFAAGLTRKGSGGTLAGVAMALKARNPAIRAVLADPEGSVLFGWVKSNDLTVSGSSRTTSPRR